MDRVKTLAQAKALRAKDDLEGSQELLLALYDEQPDDPTVIFELGGSYDVMGIEDLAIPYYREAIEKGLAGDELQECLVCLGSSLRYIGAYDEAVEVLDEATARFPGRNSSRIFWAMAQYNAGNYEASVSELITLLLETSKDPDILAYANALSYYKDNLDEQLDDLDDIEEDEA